LFFGSWGVIVATFLFQAASVPLTLFICSPREKIWDSYYEGGKCMNIKAALYASAVFNIMADIVILLLPVRSVLKLQIDTNKKVGIILLFGTGLL
jgi:hypothetical protein